MSQNLGLLEKNLSSKYGKEILTKIKIEILGLQRDSSIVKLEFKRYQVLQNFDLRLTFVRTEYEVDHVCRKAQPFLGCPAGQKLENASCIHGLGLTEGDLDDNPKRNPLKSLENIPEKGRPPINPKNPHGPSSIASNCSIKKPSSTGPTAPPKKLNPSATLNAKNPPNPIPKTNSEETANSWPGPSKDYKKDTQNCKPQQSSIPSQTNPDTSTKSHSLSFKSKSQKSRTRPHPRPNPLAQPPTPSPKSISLERSKHNISNICKVPTINDLMYNNIKGGLKPSKPLHHQLTTNNQNLGSNMDNFYKDHEQLFRHQEEIFCMGKSDGKRLDGEIERKYKSYKEIGSGANGVGVDSLGQGYGHGQGSSIDGYDPSEGVGSRVSTQIISYNEQIEQREDMVITKRLEVGKARAGEVQGMDGDGGLSTESSLRKKKMTAVDNGKLLKECLKVNSEKNVNLESTGLVVEGQNALNKSEMAINMVQGVNPKDKPQGRPPIPDYNQPLTQKTKFLLKKSTGVNIDARPPQNKISVSDIETYSNRRDMRTKNYGLEGTLGHTSSQTNNKTIVGGSCKSINMIPKLKKTLSNPDPDEANLVSRIRAIDYEKIYHQKDQLSIQANFNLKENNPVTSNTNTKNFNLDVFNLKKNVLKPLTLEDRNISGVLNGRGPIKKRRMEDSPVDQEANRGNTSYDDNINITLIGRNNFKKPTRGVGRNYESKNSAPPRQINLINNSDNDNGLIIGPEGKGLRDGF